MRKFKKEMSRIFRSMDDHHGRWEIVLTIIAIIVAVFLYCVTQRQVDVARDTFQYQRQRDSLSYIGERIKDSINLSIQIKSFDLTKRSVALAESSVEVSRRNADLSAEITKLNLRAYLAIAEPRMSDIKVGSTPKATILVKNIGKTPAYKVNCEQLVIFERDIPDRIW